MSPTRRRLLTAAGTVAAAGGAFYLGTKFDRSRTAALHRLTFRRGIVNSGRFVPGTQEVVYDAEWEGKPPQLFAARAGSMEHRPLPIPPARLLAVSRRGELAIKLEDSDTLARVSLTGGNPSEVLHNIEWADWGPDGESFLVLRQVRSHQRIDFPIGKPRYESANQLASPRISPDGQQIAFFETTPRGAILNVVDSTGGRRTLTGDWKEPSGLAWNGKEIWFSATNGADAPSVHAVSPGGVVRPVLRMPQDLALSDVAPDGRWLLTASMRREEMLFRRLSEEAVRDLSWFDDSVASDLSTNGDAVLFTEARRVPRAYLRKTDGSPAVSLGEGRALALSPDAQWAAMLKPASPRQLLIVPVAGGEPRTLQADRFTYQDARWFPDGKRLLVWGNQDDRLRRHFVQDVAGGPVRPITPESSAVDAAISPDGEYVAAYCGPGVFLFPADGAEPQPARGQTASAQPVAWSEDARSLYLRRGYIVELLDLKSGKSEVWEDLTPQNPGGISGIENVSITPDGRAYVYSYGRNQADLFLAEGL